MPSASTLRVPNGTHQVFFFIVTSIVYVCSRLTVDGVQADPPIRSRVSIGERVSFDAEPNTQRNSWGVTWKATAVRKLTAGRQQQEDPKTGIIVHVDPTAAVISFIGGSGEELCAVSINHGLEINDVQVRSRIYCFLNITTVLKLT